MSLDGISSRSFDVATLQDVKASGSVKERTPTASTEVDPETTTNATSGNKLLAAASGFSLSGSTVRLASEQDSTADLEPNGQQVELESNFEDNINRLNEIANELFRSVDSSFELASELALEGSGAGIVIETLSVENFQDIVTNANAQPNNLARVIGGTDSEAGISRADLAVAVASKLITIEAETGEVSLTSLGQLINNSADENGNIDFEAFDQATDFGRENIASAFNLTDTNGDGLVNANEILNAVKMEILSLDQNGYISIADDL